MNEDFFSMYRNSPIETAIVQEVNKTEIPAPTAISGTETRNVVIPHYSCRIKTEEREFDKVTWLSPYTNHTDGSGMYVVPRRGTACLIVFAKGGQPYIIGWLSPVGNGVHTGNREAMPDGSMVMRSPTGSKVLVEAGGIIRIQSSPTCRRSHNPSFDQIRDFCRNYFLTTAGGTVSYTESRDGQRLTKMVIETFEKADDQSTDVNGPGESVRVQHGTHIEDEDDPEFDTPPGKIFSFLVAKNTIVYIAKNGRIIIRNQQPETGTDPNKITIDNDGEFILNNVKEVQINTETGAINMVAGSGGETKLTMAPDGDVALESATKVTIAAPEVVIEGDGQVTIDGGLVDIKGTTQVNVDAPNIQLGIGGLPAARLGDTVISASFHGPITGTIISGSAIVFEA